MIDTPVNMTKVREMLDAGRVVVMYQNQLTSYTVAVFESYDEFESGGELCVSDDFTPEQALTRAAHKAEGTIL